MYNSCRILAEEWWETEKAGLSRTIHSVQLQSVQVFVKVLWIGFLLYGKLVSFRLSSSSSKSVFPINEGLSSIDEIAIGKKRVRSRAHCRRKFARKGRRWSGQQMQNDEEECLWQLKEKFFATTSRSVQSTVLTLFSKFWSFCRVQKEFSTTLHMARTSRNLVDEKRMISPKLKAGITLSEGVVATVWSFYTFDDMNKVMACKKDSIIVREGEEKKQVQKRFIVCNLEEAHCAFKKSHPEVEIGFLNSHCSGRSFASLLVHLELTRSEYNPFIKTSNWWLK